jgi:hypothetical protein
VPHVQGEARMSYSSDEIRTLEQNKKFHAMVGDIAKQVKWADEFMEAEDWKRLFLAAKYEQKVVPNPLDPHGRFVVMNNRRSRALTVQEMAEFITEIEVFGIERGVDWSEDE